MDKTSIVIIDPSEEEEVQISENADDYEEVLRRQDDLDQMTADYLRAMIGLEGEFIDLEDIGIDVSVLSSIEDSVEEILSEYGITIYHPVIIEDENGNEVIVNNDGSELFIDNINSNE